MPGGGRRRSRVGVARSLAVAAGAGQATGRPLVVLTDEVLDRSHGQPFVGGALGQTFLVAAVRSTKQGAGMAGGDLSLRQQTLGPGGQLE